MTYGTEADLCLPGGKEDWSSTKQLQTGAIISIHKKGDKRKCTNYMASISSVTPVRFMPSALKCRKIVEPKLSDVLCGFHSGQNQMDHIFALQQQWRTVSIF